MCEMKFNYIEDKYLSLWAKVQKNSDENRYFGDTTVISKGGARWRSG